jgi:hypothetical protein
VVRSVLLRKVNLKVWAAFCVGSVPLLVMLPLIQTASQVAKRFEPAFSFSQVWEIYHVLGVESAPALVLILALVAVFGSRVRPVTDAATLSALIGMFLLPALVYVLAAFRTGRLFARYALPMLIGVSVLAAPLAAGVRFGRWRPGSIVASAFAMLALFSWTIYLRNTPGIAFLKKEISQLESITASTDAPIVFLDSEAYLPLQHYASEAFRKRLARLDFRPITVVDRLRPAHEMWLVRSQRDFDSYPAYWALGNVSGLERLIRDGEHLEAAGYWRGEPVCRVYPSRRRSMPGLR